MPFAWGAPWILFQVLLHCFVSQGLFVVDVSAYEEVGTLNTEHGSIHNCGFSPTTMLLAMISAAVMMLGAAAVALRGFPLGSPPVLGNNSAVICAACHPRHYDVITKYQELNFSRVSYLPGATVWDIAHSLRSQRRMRRGRRPSFRLSYTEREFHISESSCLAFSGQEVQNHHYQNRFAELSKSSIVLRSQALVAQSPSLCTIGQM